MNLVSHYYKKRFKTLSYNVILNFFQDLRAFKIILFYDKQTYCKYKDGIPLAELNIVEKIDIESFDFIKKDIDSSMKILVLVERYFYYSKFLNFLDKNHQNNYNDICKLFLIDLAMLNNKEASKLFSNIAKLEKSMSKQDAELVIKRDYNSYIELFEALLFRAKEFKYNSIMAFFYNHIYYDTFGSIIHKLPDCIVFCDDDYSKDNFFYGLNYLKAFDFVDIFLGTYTKELPQKSMFINFNHGIVDDPAITLNQKDFSLYKNSSTKQIDINIVSSKLLNSENSICLGYPKLDKFISYYNQHKAETNNITIATSNIIWNFEKLSPVVIDSGFIPNLLDTFFNNQISFRPHPGCVKHPYIQKYVKALEKYTNFTFDTQKSYLENFSKTKVFVADGLSSSAYTYAFATLKPVIFYIPNYTQYTNDYSNLEYVKNMEIIGQIAKSQNELIKLVDEHLTNSKFYKNASVGIQKLRDSIIKNIGCSENKIVDYLENVRRASHSIVLRNYYENKFSKMAKKNITNFFDTFRNTKIAIYGAGTHFEKVLKKHYNFKKLNVLFFCDKNRDLIGKTIDDVPIVAIENLKNVDAVIISSRAYEIQIKKELEQNFKNIYTIYDKLLYDFLVLSDTKRDKALLNKLWLEVQELESNMEHEEIKQLIKNDYSSYKQLKNACTK